MNVNVNVTDKFKLLVIRVSMCLGSDLGAVPQKLFDPRFKRHSYKMAVVLRAE